MHMGSVPGTTTFCSQSATILVASLLLYVVFFDLNKFLLSSLYVYLIASFYFYMHVLALILPFVSLPRHCF